MREGILRKRTPLYGNSFTLVSKRKHRINEDWDIYLRGFPYPFTPLDIQEVLSNEDLMYDNPLPEGQRRVIKCLFRIRKFE